ncbi:hypothetical protein IscW_ISCW022188 [Ixodes scapularis]|uniref:Uncharacterized protein n=1 Tax=Ixodes scapularis TaxID=6945 RepID=B7QDG5_IXOSC|nr:hypothetical protein IscW_ISCW022188 [Ixodes scapularis]|eukprot:XP_002413579.1 hypothetical protein IscW_ISCW022188 [Ixodes scapularis]
MELVSTVFLLKDGLEADSGALSFSNLGCEENLELKELLVKCSISPTYLGADKVLEQSIQDVMHMAVNGQYTAAQHDRLFKFLAIFHSKQKDRHLSAMLCRNYEPILWRGLKVKNDLVYYWIENIGKGETE